VKRAWILAAVLAAASCGPGRLGDSETTPTLPGDDPVGAAAAQKPAAAAKPATAGKPAADPWAGKKDLIAAPAAKPLGPVALPATERFELPNGLAVIVMPDRELPVVSMHLAVRAGQEAEPREKRGISDFAAALLPKGTKTRNAEQIAQAVEQAGASLNAGVDFEATHLQCQTTTRNVATCFDVLPDVVANPAFADKDITAVRAQIASAVKQRREAASAIAEDHFDNALWGDDHVRGWPVTLETVGSITRQDLLDWHAKRFTPANSVLIIVGDVDPKAVRAQVQKGFGAWKKAPAPEAKKFAPPVLKGVRVRLVDKPDQTQALVRVGHLGVAHGDADYLPVLLDNQVLGGGDEASRLMVAAHKLKGSSQVSTSQFDRYRTRGAFQAQIVVKSADTVAGVKLLQGELARLQRSGPTAAELAAAKATLGGSYPLAFESAAAKAALLVAADLHGLGDAYVREFPARLGQVTLAEAQAAAKKYFAADDLVVVIVGNAAEIGPALTKAKIPFEAVSYLVPVSKRDREAAEAARNAPPDPKKTAEGRKLLDAAIAARGGAKFLGLKELHASGKVSILAQGKTVSGDYARFLRAPDQSRTDITLPGRGTVKMVVSPKSAWVEFQGKVQDIPDDSLAAVNVLLFVDPERVLLLGQDKTTIVQSEGPQTLEGNTYDSVRVRSADGKYEALIILDGKTHLPFRIGYSVQGDTLYDEYDDYQAVGGVQVAHKVRTVNLLLQVPVEIEYDKVEVNAGVAKDTFDRPE
jgi:zinc protease